MISLELFPYRTTQLFAVFISASYANAVSVMRCGVFDTRKGSAFIEMGATKVVCTMLAFEIFFEAQTSRELGSSCNHYRSFGGGGREEFADPRLESRQSTRTIEKEMWHKLLLDCCMASKEKVGG